jgi:Catalase
MRTFFQNEGSGAHGTFTVTHDITRYTKAKIFSKIGEHPGDRTDLERSVALARQRTNSVDRESPRIDIGSLLRNRATSHAEANITPDPALDDGSRGRRRGRG